MQALSHTLLVKKMSVNVLLSIIVTALATYLSRFLGVLSSVKIKENSKIFRWFNCLAYATLAALIARTIIFPVGILSEASHFSRLIVVIFSLTVFFVTKKNFVYPTIFSAITMGIFNNFF